MRKYDVAIIGAGPSGIFCARKLQEAGKKVAIFEKSNNIGGRLATRRFKDHVFNIGVNSFQSTVDELNEMVEAGIENETLIRDGVEVKAHDSITSWTKSLVEKIETHRKHHLESIEVGENENILHFSGDDEDVAAKDIVLAVPAPQAIEILKASNLKLSPLSKVSYSSAIFYMVAMDRELGEVKEFKVLQHVKKDLDYYLLSFEEDWSEKSKEELREEFDEVFQPVESYVHKWKYAKVDKTISSDHQLGLKDKGIYLTGDYFFGNDLDSSVLASQHILDNVFHIN